MAGRPGRSGGHNRLPVELHLARGTFRPDRHILPRPMAPISEADRRRTLRGLPSLSRRIAVDLLARFEGWDASALETLRAYAMSCHRLDALHQGAAGGSPELSREIRANLALLAALGLETKR